MRFCIKVPFTSCCFCLYHLADVILSVSYCEQTKNVCTRPVYDSGSSTLTGPTVDRIFFALLEINTVLGIPAESISFLMIDLCLLLLIFFDYRTGKSIQTLLICLGIYIIGQVFYFLADESPLWDSSATLIFNY